MQIPPAEEMVGKARKEAAKILEDRTERSGKVRRIQRASYFILVRLLARPE